jgi:hypothetical protein
LPEGAQASAGPEETDVAIVFADGQAALRAILAAQGEPLRHVPLVWVAYPKGNRADLNRDSLWPIVAELGLRPVAQVAIDDVWSALRFRPLAPGEAQFSGARRGGRA